MVKGYRAGGKFCGKHGTCVPTAAIVADIAKACPFVTRILLGYISSGLKSARGLLRVKLRDEGGCLLLSIRDNGAHQEIRVYVSDKEQAKLHLSTGIQKAGIKVHIIT